MKKAAEAFRSIGEVSQLIGVAPHVLRYWESQFPLFTPVKRRDGRRYYRPDDIRLAAGLCEMLREDGISIRGAKKQMQADRGAGLKARGAARLGGVFARTTPESAAMPPAAPPVPEAASLATVAPVAEAPARPPARRRKHAMPDSLPLFPDLELPAPAPAPAPASMPKAEPSPRRAEQAGVRATSWLARLAAIRADLAEAPQLCPRQAGAALQALSQRRRALAA